MVTESESKRVSWGFAKTASRPSWWVGPTFLNLVGWCNHFQTWCPVQPISSWSNCQLVQPVLTSQGPVCIFHIAYPTPRNAFFVGLFVQKYCIFFSAMCILVLHIFTIKLTCFPLLYSSSKLTQTSNPHIFQALSICWPWNMKGFWVIAIEQESQVAHHLVAKA